MTNTLLELPLAAIRPHPENVRDNLTELDDLAQSLREVGLIQPLTVAPDGDGYVLVAGHRRYAAAKLAALETVPAVVRVDLVGKKLIEAMLVENLHRVDLSPIEEAKAVRKLVDECGMLQQDVARRLGRPDSWVSHRLTLLKLPPELQGRLTAKEITLKQAVDLARTFARGGNPAEIDPDYNRPHFGNKHPLARKAKALCDPQHRMRRRLGGMACGSCWEQVIREDERAQRLGKPAAFNGVPKQEPERARAQKPRSDTVVPIADNNDGDAAEPPSRLSGKRAPRAAGEVVLSGGAIAKFDSAATQRDEEGRVICRACGVYISSSMGCGCDPGELDDDGHPLDPRYSEMVVEVCAR